MEDSRPAVTVTPLRRRLLVLTAAGILPLAVMAGVGLYGLAAQQRAEARRVGMELARSVATAVDAELQSAVSVLAALATSPTLERDDLVGFPRPCPSPARARSRPGTRSRSRSGRPAAPRFALPYGGALPPIIERDPPSFDRLVRTRTPVVGNLARSPEGAFVFPVRVPVAREGGLRYVLTAVIKPDAMREVVTRQRLPADWILSIFDANNLRVARSRAHDETLAVSPPRRCSASWRALRRRASARRGTSKATGSTRRTAG